MSKNVQTTTQLHSSHILVKLCSKFSKPGFNSTWTANLQMFKLDLEKAEEPEIKLPTSVGSSKNKRVPEKHLLLLYWLCQSLWLCGSQQTRKFWKRWEYQTTWPASWEFSMQLKMQQLEPDMEWQTGSKLGKEYIKDVYSHPAYLSSMHVKCWAGWITSWNQNCWEKYPYPQICIWYHPNGRKWRGTKEPLEGERAEWKSWLKT